MELSQEALKVLKSFVRWPVITSKYIPRLNQKHGPNTQSLLDELLDRKCITEQENSLLLTHSGLLYYESKYPSQEQKTPQHGPTELSKKFNTGTIGDVLFNAKLQSRK